MKVKVVHCHFTKKIIAYFETLQILKKNGNGEKNFISVNRIIFSLQPIMGVLAILMKHALPLIIYRYFSINKRAIEY